MAQAAGASLGAGLVTTLGTRATGLARNWAEALAYGATVSTLAISALYVYPTFAAWSEYQIAAQSGGLLQSQLYRLVHIFNAGVRADMVVARQLLIDVY